MNAVRFLTVILPSVLLSACVSYSGPNTSSPYGAWRSREGLELRINRNDTYELCYSGSCAFGRFRLIFDGTGAELTGFFLTDSLRKYAVDHPDTPGVTEQKLAATGGALQFAVGKMEKSTEAAICGRPCVVIGNLDRLQPDAFFKQSDG